MRIHYAKCYRDGIIPSNDNVTEGVMSIEDRSGGGINNYVGALTVVGSSFISNTAVAFGSPNNCDSTIMSQGNNLESANSRSPSTASEAASSHSAVSKARRPA